jgi:hypothetical protein
MVTTRLALLGLFAAGSTACAVTPTSTARDPVPHRGALNGPWRVKLAQSSGSEWDLRMTFETRPGDRWTAYAGEGRARWFVSLPRFVAGRLTGKLPPRSALLHVADGRSTRRGDTLIVRGTIETLMFGRFHLTGAAAHGRITGELRRDSLGVVVGTIDGVPHSGARPLRDYRAVAGRIRGEVERRIYDPHLVTNDEWRGFFARLDERMASARDDLEALAAFYSLRPRIAMTHFDLTRNPALAATPQDSLILAASGNPRSLVSLSVPAPGVAVLRIRRFDAVSAAVDAAFARIDSIGPHTLVIDIRGNPGGDVSSLSAATHLLRDSAIVGVFLSRKWYQSNRRPPTRAELGTLPRLSDPKASTLIYGVREHGAMVGVAPPQEPRYAGRVYLLLDRRSGSASEPLAHFLKVNQLATLVGERSAGGMLSALPFALDEGFVAVIPEADYYTADGQRLEGAGVAPHVAVPSADAMLAVGERVRATHPFAGAMLLGGANQELARWAEAQRWFAEAVRHGPDSARAVLGLGRALQEQKQWDAAFEQFERALRLVADDPGATFQIGRTAALSGQRLERGEAMLRRYLQAPAVPGQPTHASARWRLGMILESRGQLGAALEEYQEAARLEPGNALVAGSLRALRQRM